MHKVLIVDDEQEIIKILDEFLSKKGFKILTALGGKEAIELIKTNPAIDIMVLDIKMPEIDGVSVLESMKKAKIAIPVIILSGSIGLGKHIDSLRNLGYSYSDVLYKPIDLFALLEAVEKKLSKK